MIPTSPLAGVLTGLADGTIIALVVFLAVYLTGRRHRAPVAIHPVAEDGVSKPRTRPAEGELPKAG